MSSKGSHDDEEEEKKLEFFKYFTEEATIQPNNERTQKIRREAREKELLNQKAKEEIDNKKKFEDNAKKEDDKRAKDLLRMQAEKKKMQEIKKEEAIQELHELKGNFAKTVLEMRSNITALEMTLTGTDFTQVQRRLIYNAFENNTSVRVSFELLKYF